METKETSEKSSSKSAMKYTIAQLSKMKEFSKYSYDFMKAILKDNALYTKEDAIKTLKNYFKE